MRAGASPQPRGLRGERRAAAAAALVQLRA